jgi:hypothetical protein
MASEIERLPDLTGFLKLASLPDWQLAALSYKSAPNNVSWRPSICTSTPAPPPASSAPATSTPSATSSASEPAFVKSDTPPASLRKVALRHAGATFSGFRKSRFGEAQECKAEAPGSLVLVVPLILLTR